MSNLFQKKSRLVSKVFNVISSKILLYLLLGLGRARPPYPLLVSPSKLDCLKLAYALRLELRTIILPLKVKILLVYWKCNVTINYVQSRKFYVHWPNGPNEPDAGKTLLLIDKNKIFLGLQEYGAY